MKQTALAIAMMTAVGWHGAVSAEMTLEERVSEQRQVIKEKGPGISMRWLRFWRHSPTNAMNTCCSMHSEHKT